MTEPTDVKKIDATQYKITSFGPSAQQGGAVGGIQGNAFDPEDEYQTLYVGAARDMGILEPPYFLRTLDRLSQENNALGPCIEAMVTNIDGTGYEFDNGELEDDDEEDDANIEELEEFFDEPWPQMSFTQIRRLVRRDVERVGNGYLEVIRDPLDNIVFVRHVDGKMMRLVRLDDPIAVQKTVMRKGEKVSILVNVRERRFVQLLNGVTIVYFKEYGSSRDLNKSTGRWLAPGERIAPQVRATEIIHFTALPDAHTPYGIPRWVNQMPSVLGSRKAEEFNLEFFDNGGVPPVIILLQGGVLGTETRRALEQKTTGPAAKNNRIQVVEVEPSGGSLTQAAQARVTVERFGAERQSDAMFQMYDTNCEDRIRRSFRLPPIFVGQAKDYSFATAFASYTVAEAQVFKPERDDFDKKIGMTLIAGLGYDGYSMKSKSLTIEDATLKLQGIQMGIATGAVEMDSVVEAINHNAGLMLKFKAPAPPPDPMAATHTVGPDGQLTPINPDPVDPSADASKGQQGVGDNGNAPGAPPTVKTPPAQGSQLASTTNGGSSTPVHKADLSVYELAQEAMIAMRKRDIPTMTRHLKTVSTLDAKGLFMFKQACAQLQFLDSTASGMGELSACTMAVIAANNG